MKVNKLKVILKYFTGGIASVVEYLLDLFNNLIAKLPSGEVAKYAQLAKDIANFISNVATLFIRNEAKKAAAQMTATCFADLATALLDARLTEDELDALIETIKKAIQAWKDAK